jgi:hypothetical protein
VRGAIIAESLKPGTVLEVDGMRLVRWSRYEVLDVPGYQPRMWTLIEFEAPDEGSGALADMLADALLEPGWYANWNSSEGEATVVFPGKVFRYPHGDTAGREAAKEHGRRCGVPEPQLDWSD